MLLAALLVFRLRVYEPPAPPPAAAAPVAPPSRVVQAAVLSVQGGVERGRDGAAWSAVEPGHVYRTTCSRTGAHGHPIPPSGRSRAWSIGESSECRSAN